MTTLSKRNVDIDGNAKWEAYMDASARFNVEYGMLSTAAHERYLDATDMLESTPYYSRNVKHWKKRADRAWEMYYRNVGRAFHDKFPLYVDFCNKAYQHIETDLEKFYNSIKRVLDRHRVGDSDLKARLVLAYELTELCRKFFVKYWEICSKHYGYEDLGRPFRYADPSPMASLTSSLVDSVCGGPSTDDIRLDDDPDCGRALTIVIKRVHEAKTLDELGIEALRMNASYDPEYAEAVRLHDEDRERERLEAETRARRDDETREEEAHRAVAARLAEKYTVRHGRT